MEPISSTDPDAVAKLKDKLAGMERGRDEAKAVNAYWRKHGTMAGFPGLSEEGAARIDSKMAEQNAPGASWVADKQKVYPTYHFTNLSGNIRRVRERIEQLEREADTPPAEDVNGNGWCIAEDDTEKRVNVTFDEKPSRDVCKAMRGFGFLWSPRRVAWTRKLTPAARLSATLAGQYLTEQYS